ncbi:extracellular solute-binding protein [Bremerella cremea]|uniref:extracellular solute-binding protein n=1 Tax=Bremerella cremea TaxID=1031537 RepID=UPI0031EE78C5
MHRRAAFRTIALVLLTAILAIGLLVTQQLLSNVRHEIPADREEVVFWHFWGGADRAIVEDVAQRFNQSQSKYFVRPIAMPGNNLDLKFFLSVTGGDPPDLLNIDDPVIADWGHRGAILALDEVASPAEIDALKAWLFPAARRLVTYEDHLYGVPNGLDIRALYYNQTMLDRYGLSPPHTIEELDHIATTIAPPDQNEPYQHHGFLPDSRRIWAWGPVFGGQFYDASTNEVTLTSPPIESALAWMASYRDRYGPSEIARFRHGDQSLPGKTFPLFAERYAVVMDGQWRVRDIRAFQKSQAEKGEPVTQFGAIALPSPPGGKQNAGWVNGNNFVIPRGAKSASGAWAFIQFWCGFAGHEAEAARTCVAGGWIPVSQQVVDQPDFQTFLNDEPLFRTFIELAGSDQQYPVPVIPGAPYFNNEVKNVAESAMASPTPPDLNQMLQDAQMRIQSHIDRARNSE